MNIKLRFENPAVLISLIVDVIALVYEVLAICGVTPWLAEDDAVNLVTQIVTIVFTLLVGLGIIVDPTTSGISDSEQAMTYESPKKDTEVQDVGA